MTGIPEYIRLLAQGAADEFFARAAYGEGEADIIIDLVAGALTSERNRCDIASQALIDEYVTAERERCAKIVETQKVYEIGDRIALASAIRNPKT